MSVLLRAMTAAEWPTVAQIVHDGTNAWYEANGREPVFQCTPQDVELFCQVYEALDPGCCVVAEDVATGQLLGSCFYHPRPTHVSLGIMNAHPDAFGRGLANQLLDFVIERAGRDGKPVRLVSSAMNLDSFSLYNRKGFVPIATYQDMLLQVPGDGFAQQPIGFDRVRPASHADVEAMVDLERDVSGIERGADFAHFIDNPEGIWHVSVLESALDGSIEGFLASVRSDASDMLGPGVMRNSFGALALIAAELDELRGRTPVFLVPSNQPALTSVLYDWGARNCELHVAQVLGDAEPPRGVTMPTFLPETG